MHFYLSYLGWMSADWKNKCWFTIYNRCFIYDSNIYFGALIWFFAPSPASTYGIEDLPFSIEDVSQFQNRLVILYQSGETQIWYYIIFCRAFNLGWMSILHTVTSLYFVFFIFIMITTNFAYYAAFHGCPLISWNKKIKK